MKRITIKGSLGLLLLIASNSRALSSILYMDQLSVAMGMTMSSFTQLEGAVVGQSKSGSSPALISVDINYEIFQFRNLSHVFKLTGTGVLVAGIEKYYGVGYGVRWYFGSEGTRIKLKDKILVVDLTPKFRYFAGANVGGYYYVYRPEPNGEEIRNDIGAELGGHAGIMYGNHHKRAYKAQVNFFMGSGAETQTTIMQFFLGATFYLEPLL